MWRTALLGILSFCCIVISASPIAAAPKECPPSFDSNSREFVGVSERHRQNLGQMMRYRSPIKNHYQGFRAFELRDVVERLRAFERARPVRVGLLFYDYAEHRRQIKDLADGTTSEHLLSTLRVFLVSTDGLEAYECLEIGHRNLDERHSALRAALKVDALQAARAPRRRDAPSTRATSPSSPAPDARRAIADMTDVLLPRGIGVKLRPLSHLIVVPALGIGTVPFALLTPFGVDEALIDRLTVTIAPSLYDLGDGGRPWPSTYHPQRALVVGNPAFNDRDWALPPLPGAEREAVLAAKVFGSAALLRDRATKNDVLREARDADVLYLASHALADAADPLNGSFIALAGDPARSRWSALEIQRTRFRARLAVLSAGQTGLGGTHDAGVIGLARGFQISGVPRVVVSLWNVDDSATADLMQTFVQELAARPPADALRQAMLRTRRAFPEPLQWASFTLFGTPW